MAIDPGRQGGLPHLEEAIGATAALVETVRLLSDDDVRRPSVLPGWSRAHVVTHVARNADALVHVLSGPGAGQVRAQYPSAAEREAAIEAGAGLGAGQLLDDLVAACTRWEHAAAQVSVAHLDELGARMPEGPTFPLRKVGMFRRTEVEVHHADLDAGYTAADWPPDLVAALMGRRRKELENRGVALRWTPTDTGETWASAVDGPEVTGTAADLLWWLLGRGIGEGLACSDGTLPSIGRWT